MVLKRVVIVGAGITGLAAAYRLQKKAAEQSIPLEIQILEASSHLGGIFQTTAREGFLLEGGADCFLSEKPRGIGLCKELGIDQELIPVQPAYRRSMIVRHGKLRKIPKGFYLIGPTRIFPFLFSSVMSWGGQMRALTEPLLPRRPQDDESLASLVRRRYGNEMLERMAQPLLAGIYGANPETLSLRATFPQFLDMEKQYGSIRRGLRSRAFQPNATRGARYNLFFTFKEGMHRLVAKLAESLPPETIQWNTQVRDIKNVYPGLSQGWQVRLTNGNTVIADSVLLAMPAWACAEVVRGEYPTLAQVLGKIPYTDSVTLNLAYEEKAIKHRMQASGYVVPAIEKRFVNACTFVHRKFEGRAPKGYALLRAFVGGSLQPMVLNKTDYEIEQLVVRDLQTLLKISRDPLFTVLQRHPRAMPQYTLGHVDRINQIDELRAPAKGLTLAGNWLRGVGIPDCIASGERAADEIIDQFSARHSPQT